ncbi:MAG: OmpA family protein [Spirochaetia bacterium]|nr:OmpA family protein [Spirochaetia bacterium]
MAKKKAKCNCPDPPPVWLTSWGDMTTLMLTFFVIIVGKPSEPLDFRIVMSAFKGSLGLFQGGQTLSAGKLEHMGMTITSMPAQDTGRGLAKATKVATEIFKPEIKARKISVVQDERGIVISLIGDNYFAHGSALLTSEGKNVLSKISPLLREINAFIRIEGHTNDSLTPDKNKYETNWELGAMRALNSLRFLNEFEDVEPGKMSAVTYGKYRPISKSKTPEGRALNRRVDIVILTDMPYKRDYKDEFLPGSRVPTIEFKP